jgi:hypothetical protein
MEVEAVDGGAEGLAVGLRGECRGEGVAGDPGGLGEGGVEVGLLVVVRREVVVRGGEAAVALPTVFDEIGLENAIAENPELRRPLPDKVLRKLQGRKGARSKGSTRK